MRDIQHDLSVTRPAEGEQHLEGLVQRLGLTGLPDPFARMETEVDERDQGSRHEGGDQGHQHQHHEDGGRQDLHLITDGQNDQLHQSAGVHQGTHIEAVPPTFAHKTG